MNVSIHHMGRRRCAGAQFVGCVKSGLVSWLETAKYFSHAAHNCACFDAYLFDLPVTNKDDIDLFHIAADRRLRNEQSR